MIGSRCWPEQAIEGVRGSENSQARVYAFWALPQSTNRRAASAHLNGVKSFPIGGEASRGRREQMSWERRASSQPKCSKSEVKTFERVTGHGADSAHGQLHIHSQLYKHACGALVQTKQTHAWYNIQRPEEMVLGV